MKKLLIDARESGTSTGRYVDKLVEYLYKLKPEFEVIILTKSPRIKFFKDLAPGFEVIKSDYKEFTFAEQLGFSRQLKSLKPDLVHFGMTQQPFVYLGKTITTIHDLTTIRFDNPAKNKLIFKFKQRVYSGLIKHAARTSTAVITPSRYVKQDVAQYAKISPDKIFVTYEAADKITEPAKAVPRLAGKQFIMYVGRALPHKNLPRLVQAFELLRQKHPDLMLVLAGKNDANYQRIGQLVSDKRLAGSAVFTDFVSDGELRWLYEHTAAYIFPSLSEGFGLPSLEAMTHGAPVASSKATCLPEVNGKAAIYFDPMDARDMAAKIDKVLSSPPLKAELVKRGRAQAAKYSWRTMAQQTLNIYKKILS